MCGFIATRNLNHDLFELIDNMSYRGLPDYKGHVCYSDATGPATADYQFAHVSLPFVDLDPGKAIQPVPFKEHPTVFVGEIFNYEEFGYESDIEMANDLMGPYNDWVSTLHASDGFWTIVTIKNGTLFGVTDHLGIKPLYYRTDMDAMASEPDVLRELGPVTEDKLFMSNVLKWGYDPTPRSPWNEIKQVPPGHYVQNGICRPYWNWNRVRITDLKTDLINSLTGRLKGQQKIGLLLSGGLDSSIIYKLLEEHDKVDLESVHIDNGEEEFVKLLTDNYNKVSLFIDWTSSIQCNIAQTPVDLGSTKQQYLMAEQLDRLGIRAVLTGDGADELFGGYRRAKEYDSQYSDMFCELPYYHLPKIDRMMMARTIEARPVYLAPTVVRHALNTPYNMRNGYKKVLMALAQEIGVPDEIIYRPKHALKTRQIAESPMERRLEMAEAWRNQDNWIK